MTKNQAPSRGPDYGIAKILRGFSGFEDIYQGLSRGIPIALSPYGSKTGGREQNAASNYAALSSALAKQTVGGDPVDGNVDGIHSPNLVDAVPTVFGANCVFMLPRPTTSVDNPEDPLFEPMYKLIWRTRTIDTFAKSQLPFHANLRGFRYQDTQITTQLGYQNVSTGPVLTGLAAQRAVLATVEETLRFTPTPPTTDPLAKLAYQPALDLGVQPAPPYGEIRAFDQGEGIAPFTQGPILPFVGPYAEINTTTGRPYVYGDLGQNPITAAASLGLSLGDQVALTTRAQVSHVSYSTVAKGDEVIILVYNVPKGGSVVAPGTYNFDAGEDFLFSCLFGRGGYENPFGSIINPQKPLFPNGTPFGVYLVQGHG